MVTPPAAVSVICPAPSWMTVSVVPIGNATLAFVGTVKVLADASDMVTKLFASAKTAVYAATLDPCALTETPLPIVKVMTPLDIVGDVIPVLVRAVIPFRLIVAIDLHSLYSNVQCVLH